MPWVGLQSVIVAFPDHTHLRFYMSLTNYMSMKIHGHKCVEVAMCCKMGFLLLLFSGKSCGRSSFDSI